MFSFFKFINFIKVLKIVQYVWVGVRVSTCLSVQKLINCIINNTTLRRFDKQLSDHTVFALHVFYVILD